MPTPCPLPLITFSKRDNLAATGGGENSIHLISKGAMVASGDRPSPTEPAGETPLWNPRGVENGGKQFIFGGFWRSPPQSRLCRDSSPCGGAETCLPHRGRCRRRRRRGCFPSVPRPATEKFFACFLARKQDGTPQACPCASSPAGKDGKGECSRCPTTPTGWNLPGR